MGNIFYKLCALVNQVGLTNYVRILLQLLIHCLLLLSIFIYAQNACDHKSGKLGWFLFCQPFDEGAEFGKSFISLKFEILWNGHTSCAVQETGSRHAGSFGKIATILIY